MFNSVALRDSTNHSLLAKLTDLNREDFIGALELKLKSDTSKSEA
jgi:hypothetical protein